MTYKLGVVLLVVTYMSVTTALPPCVCMRNLAPVCGSDGKTYSNPCVLNCKSLENKDLQIEKLGPCTSDYQPKVCVCTDDYNPVCGSNGITYPNLCALECENGLVEVAYNGECKKPEEEVSVAKLPPCTCTREKSLVCGTDGNTYSNPCMLNCAREVNKDLQIDHQGACSSEVKVVNIAEKNLCTCNKDLEPVCASNGVTFGNTCQLHCAGTHLTVAHYGPCESA